jgi:uncharacterized SAM-binding protein YcdF (DUF218 family)
MYLLNKIVGGLLNPLMIGLVMVVASGLCLWRSWRKTGVGLLIVSVAWLWLWSTPMMYRWLGGALESEWPVVKAEDAPQADAIVLLGGGMGSNTNVYPYAEMWNGADRVWHAARLYKAGKAPMIIPTGRGEQESTVPLLRDLGVPESAIVVEGEARNTEENARFVEKILEPRNTQNTRKRVLLVTSAWHMRRSVLMYRRYAPSLEIIPAAADYEATVNTSHPFCFKDIWPDTNALFANSYIFKEYLGYWGYRLFRR